MNQDDNRDGHGRDHYAWRRSVIDHLHRYLLGFVDTDTSAKSVIHCEEVESAKRVVPQEELIGLCADIARWEQYERAERDKFRTVRAPDGPPHFIEKKGTKSDEQQDAAKAAPKRQRKKKPPEQP
jgi:hypothetical protein